MKKIKYVAIVGGAVIILSAGGGFWLWRGHSKQHLHQNSGSGQGTNTEQPLTETSDPNSILLTPGQSQAKSSNGLSVAPYSAASNLGQLTPNSDGSSKPAGNSSAAPKALDPATFGEYEKYKTGNSALFGDLQVGTGDEVTANKKVAVYYKGWLTDGRLFDQTRTDKDGKLQPFVFTMGANQVIPGWEQGLFGMKVGGVRLVIVPPSVGYGAAGHDPIPGNAVLVFQVQLLAVQ